MWMAGLTLELFDPAFAGRSIPALLGEVKATFHNIFAHPLWLYTPDLAGRAYRVTAERSGDRIVVTHDWASVGPAPAAPAAEA